MPQSVQRRRKDSRVLFSLIAGLNARSLHQRDTLRNEAIITQGVVNAKSSPDRSGTDLFTVHEGTKVTIRDAPSFSKL